MDFVQWLLTSQLDDEKRKSNDESPKNETASMNDRTKG
jgi:hypothetical protein